MFGAKKSDKSEKPVPNSLPNTLADKTEIPADEAKSEGKAIAPEKETKKPKSFKELFTKDEFHSPKDINVGKDQKEETNGQKIESSNEMPVEIKEKNLEDNNGSQLVSHENMSPSFFAELEKRFTEEKSLIENHFSSDIIKKMKAFHSSETGNYFLDESTADNEIYSLLLELKGLESEWSLRFKELEAAKEAFETKEREVTEKLGIFEDALKKKRSLTLFNKKVPGENKFLLGSGVSIDSIKGLLFELRHMSDEVFNHHVTADRNDFANWVNSSLGASKLAEDISKVKSKGELINLLGSP